MHYILCFLELCSVHCFVCFKNIYLLQPVPFYSWYVPPITLFDSDALRIHINLFRTQLVHRECVWYQLFPLLWYTGCSENAMLSACISCLRGSCYDRTDESMFLICLIYLMVHLIPVRFCFQISEMHSLKRDKLVVDGFADILYSPYRLMHKQTKQILQGTLKQFVMCGEFDEKRKK